MMFHVHAKTTREYFYTNTIVWFTMDAYLEEELYDLLTYCMQNEKPSADYDHKKERIHEIGKELFSDGGADAMINMYFAIQNRIKEEIHKDANPYRSWWNGITDEWKY